jgi:DNA repair protein RecN (Recombination protein N)
VIADPSALATVRERIGVLARLRRKYGATEDEVLAYLERCKTRAGELERAGSDEAGLVDAVARARDAAASAAERLSRARHEAAPKLARAMERSMSALALPEATFEVALEARDLYRGGIENVTFMVAANPGEAPRPIAKVASGGELSRIALALRLLTSAGTAPTMVFDEVDAGVGGEAARAVGERLAELGKRPSTQVLVVTHLPQVAAFADHQYLVSKGAADGRNTSEVARVEGGARVEELSRMLAGLPESERAREHAQELLELAVREGEG